MLAGIMFLTKSADTSVNKKNKLFKTKFIVFNNYGYFWRMHHKAATKWRKIVLLVRSPDFPCFPKQAEVVGM